MSVAADNKVSAVDCHVSAALRMCRGRLRQVEGKRAALRVLRSGLA